MLTAIKGYYEGGHVYFEEQPPVTERTEVVVTFLTEERIGKSPKRTLGLLEGKAKLPDDFNEPLEELKDYM